MYAFGVATSRNLGCQLLQLLGIRRRLVIYLCDDIVFVIEKVPTDGILNEVNFEK